jgi:hypothetical protein
MHALHVFARQFEEPVLILVAYDHVHAEGSHLLWIQLCVAAGNHQHRARAGPLQVARQLPRLARRDPRHGTRVQHTQVGLFPWPDYSVPGCDESTRQALNLADI